MNEAPKTYMRMHKIVGSSNVKSVGYSVRNREMGIRFKNGIRYMYSDVPISVYRNLLDAPSKGKFVHNNVKGYYPYVKDNSKDIYSWEEGVPAKSQSQQRYFGWLYSKKKSGNTSGMSDKDIKTMNNMSAQQIRDFAATKHTNIPVVIQKAASYSQNQTTGLTRLPLVIIRELYQTAWR